MPQKKLAKTILQCKDMLVKFGQFTAINSFSFTIKEGELHFLIGPNGAGKTTFLDVLCGKTRCQSGEVYFNDHEDLTKLKEFEIVRKGIGRKFQAPSIFPHLTVYENLEIAMKQDKRLLKILFAKTTKKQHDEIEQQLNQIGLLQQCEVEARALSHGQKQWLEIGMVMMQQPKLLLLDEPIAGMTEEEEEKTGHLLQQLKKKCSIIVVEHDMDFVRKFAEKVTVMHEGRLLCDGEMDVIQKNEQVMEVYLGRKGEKSDVAYTTA
ncbi:urea ABC transporter ATP-binding protein UrtD [Halalkalibacter sp. APA_J-10(15)]|uniref:urea ABC transporter ATP-binding protein UrtD n=1 Tax=unclassified Halalkalibacter TaxID=2893063 RepID=UPI001FF3B069|nr:urea ABC transporter ATP-binding protein UrtD [Halalkalibacter sp. APA_J-10(15)]MCK0470024.1 urea ABC transporter ATP-binding protein UrtD [Halalkalibacter sp. APA_J-10(15)]